jgi:hypothetical protein
MKARFKTMGFFKKDKKEDAETAVISTTEKEKDTDSLSSVDIMAINYARLEDNRYREMILILKDINETLKEINKKA